jgi:hypothetical protein
LTAEWARRHLVDIDGAIRATTWMRLRNIRNTMLCKLTNTHRCFRVKRKECERSEPGALWWQLHRQSRVRGISQVGLIMRRPVSTFGGRQSVGVIVLAVMITGSTPQVLSAQDSQPLERIDLYERTVTRVEKCLRRNDLIAYDGSYFDEAWDASSSTWKRTGSIKYSFKSECIPEGRALFVAHDETRVWIGGPHNMSRSKFRISYDGAFGRTLIESDGPEGLPQNAKRPRGTIEPRRPVRLTEWCSKCAVWQYTIYGVGEATGEGDFANLMRRTKKRGKLTVAEGQSAEYGDLVVVRIGSSEDHRVYTLVPSKNYAIAEFKLVDSGIARHKVVIDAFDKVGDIFLPRHATMSHWDPQGRLERRGEFSTMNARQLDPAAGDFEITFPESTVVENRIIGQDETVGPSISGLARRTSLSAAKAREMLQSDALENKSRTNHLTDVEQHSNVAAYATIGICLVVAALSIRMRRRLRTSAAILLVSSCSIAYGQSSRPLSTGYLCANCGLDVTLFALEFFGIPIEERVGQVAQRLGIGERFQRAASLLDIKAATEGEGLGARAFEVHSSKGIQQLIGPERILILHLNSPSPGHFLIVAGSRGDELLVIDPPRDPIWLTIDQFDRGYGKTMSGGAIEVKKDHAVDLIPGDIASGAMHFDMRMNASVGMLYLFVPVVNSGDTEIRIEQAKGGCSCFKAAQFDNADNRLQPRAAGKVRMQFDGNRLPTGKSKQTVLLELMGARVKRTMITIDLYVERDAAVVVDQCVPDRINLPELRMGSAWSGEIAVVVPRNTIVSNWYSGDQSIEVKWLGESLEERTEAHHIFLFSVSVSVANKRDIDSRVVFGLSGKVTRDLSVIVRGRVVD